MTVIIKHKPAQNGEMEHMYSIKYKLLYFDSMVRNIAFVLSNNRHIVYLDCNITNTLVD